MSAASCLNCPIRLWGTEASGDFGLAQWTKLLKVGSRQTAVERPLQAVFLPGERRAAYLTGKPKRMMIGSLAFSRTNWNTQAPIRRRMQGPWPKDYCQTFFITTLAARCPFPRTARTLIDDVVDVFFSLLTNGKVTGDKVGPHRDLLDEFPYVSSAARLAARKSLSLKETKMRLPLLPPSSLSNEQKDLYDDIMGVVNENFRKLHDGPEGRCSHRTVQPNAALSGFRSRSTRP